MKYSTKFWLIVLIYVFCNFVYLALTPPITEGKGVFIVFAICLYTACAFEESRKRATASEDYKYSYLKYFNIFWYPYKGVMLFNRWLDKQEY